MTFHQTTIEELSVSPPEEVPLPEEGEELPETSIILREPLGKNVMLERCPLCNHEKRVYRRKLRACFVPALKALIEKGPMTTRELFDNFATNAHLAVAIKSHFSETRLWDFVEEDGNGRWVATSKAGAFVRGEIQCYRYVWPKIPTCRRGAWMRSLSMRAM